MGKDISIGDLLDELSRACASYPPAGKDEIPLQALAEKHGVKRETIERRLMKSGGDYEIVWRTLENGHIGKCVRKKANLKK